MQKFIKFNIDTTFDNAVTVENAIFKGDTLTLQVKVFGNGILADLSNQVVDLILLKSDGTVVEGVQKTISNGVLTAELTEQATLKEGVVTGTLQITENANSHISTNTFSYLVLPSIADTVLEASKNEIQTLQDLLIAISNNETVINNYTNLINQTWQTTDSIQALNSIKTYIDTNLPALISNNSQAVTNNNNLTTQNSQATTNISTLTSKNSEANNLINTLEDDIQIGDKIHSDLQLDITNGNYILSQLNTSNWFYVLSMCKLYEKTLKGSSLTDENSNIFTDENSNIFVF